MKVLVCALSAAVATLVLIGGGLVVGLNTPRPSGSGPILLATLALAVFTYGPILLGSVTAQWNTTASPEARRYIRRFTAIVLGLDALGAVAIILYAVLTGAPFWIPLVTLVAAAALLAIAFTVGRWLRHRDESRPRPQVDWRPVCRGEIVRKIAIIVVTFAGVLLLALLVIMLIRRGDDNVMPLGRGISSAVGFAAIGGAIAGMIVSLPLDRQLRETFGGDIGLTQRLAKVVQRRKPLVLDDRETLIATKYAAMVSVVTSFQLASFALLYVGIGVNQLLMAGSGRLGALGLIVPIGILAAFVVLIPLMIVRIRRARRYVTEHSHLLETPELNV